MGYKKLSSQQELCLIEEYRQGASVQALAEKYGFKTNKSITDKVKKYYPQEYQKIINTAKDNRKGYCYRIETITCEFDAYFIGLMLTDGYISNNGTIGIDLIDEDCIQFLATSIGKNYSAYDKLYTSEYNGQQIQQKHTKYRLILQDRELEENLIRFGVVLQKTKILKGPELLPEEQKFVPYIIRGIIDGDGSVAPTSYGAPQFRITCYTKQFAEWIKNALEEKCFMKDVTIFKSLSGMYTIGSAEKDNLLKLIALSYNKPFGMQRKYIELRKTFRDYNRNFFD
jgi:hypothetical protein